MSVRSQAPRSRRVRQTRRSGELVRSAPRSTTATLRALLLLVGRPTTAADLCEALGVHWRTGYRTLADLREIVPLREISARRAAGRGTSLRRGPTAGRYWIARVDLDRAIRQIQGGRS